MSEFKAVKTMWKKTWLYLQPLLEDKDIMKYVYLLHWKASMWDFNMVFLGKLKSRPSVEIKMHASSFPQKNTASILVKKVYTCVKSLQSCSDSMTPMDSSPPGSPVPTGFQARTLSRLAVPQELSNPGIDLSLYILRIGGQVFYN